MIESRHGAWRRARRLGATDNTLSHNTADNNGNDGFDVDVNSTGQYVQRQHGDRQRGLRFGGRINRQRDGRDREHVDGEHR